LGSITTDNRAPTPDVINAAGTGAVVLNASNNSGTGGVIFGSGGASATTVATINNSGNAQFNGTLQVGRHVDIYQLADGQEPGGR